ncbi:hypothetical protein WCLP8_1500007 [uncultured Gammaproteobacteria bacterium]
MLEFLPLESKVSDFNSFFQSAGAINLAYAYLEKAGCFCGDVASALIKENKDFLLRRASGAEDASIKLIHYYERIDRGIKGFLSVYRSIATAACLLCSMACILYLVYSGYYPSAMIPRSKMTSLVVFVGFALPLYIVINFVFAFIIILASFCFYLFQVISSYRNNTDTIASNALKKLEESADQVAPPSP